MTNLMQLTIIGIEENVHKYTYLFQSINESTYICT